MQALVVLVIIIFVAIGLRLFWKHALLRAVQGKCLDNTREAETDQNFHIIAEAANDGILVNQAGKHVYANKCISNMLGYRREELIGTTLHDIIHPDEYELVLQRFNNRLEGSEEPNQYETVFINKNADKIPVELTTTLTCWQGKEAGLVIIRDITERKLIEQTLRDSEKRYRSLIENSPDAIVIIDALTSQFIEANGQAVQLFKRDKPALFASSILELSPAKQADGSDSNKRWGNVTGDVIHGLPQIFEWTFYDSGHTPIPCEVRLSRMPFPNRKLIRGSIIDISQRKQIESALAASELRLTRFFQASFEVLLFHEDGIILDVNNNVTSVFGYRREEFIGRHVFEFVASHSQQQARESMASGTDVPYELDIIHKDQTFTPVVIRAKTISVDHHLQRVVSIIDNTARKQIENELIQSGRELHNILANMIDTFYRTNDKGEITMVSPSVYKLLGYQPEEVVGVKLADFYIEPDGREKFITAIAENGGCITAYEAPLRHKDGSAIWVATNAIIKTDSYGNFIGVEGITRDITEQHNINNTLRDSRDMLELRVQQRTEQLSQQVKQLERLQKELASSEQRFHTLFDSAVDIFLLHDLDGRLIDVNQQACTSLGYSKQQLLNMKVDDIDVGPDPIEIHELAEKLKIGYTFRTDSVLKRSDDSSFPVEVKIGLLQEDDQCLILALLRDITERKYAELAILTAKEQAEFASQTKSEFLSRMSHELRTPMNAVIGFSELLESDPQNPLSPAQRDNVHEILNAAHHLLELINEILDLARIESGRMSVNMGVVKVSDMINECITLIQPLASERKIMITNNTMNCCNGEIVADNTRLKQVILNLLSNAVKYNTEYGRIVLDCRQVNQHALRLTVSDTGDGMSAQQLENLFQPFERLDAERRGIEGAGIGLVISKHLVELMGGQIGVDSTTGQGSHFWIELNTSTPLLSSDPTGQNETCG